MTLVRVASINDLKDGQVKTIYAQDEAIALSKVNGKFYAITNTCPHRQGPLGDGFLEDNVVTCPLHGWQFNVTNGACQNVPGVKIETYKVVVEGNDVFVEVP